MPTIQQLAAEAAEAMETANRDSGRSFVRVKNDAPEWIRDICREAHQARYTSTGYMLPDDWRYKTIASAFECLAEAADPDDAAHEWADAEVDVYTGDRLLWLSSNVSRAGYCDEATEEGMHDRGGIVELVGCGQYLEALEVFEVVRQQLADRAETEAVA